MASPGDIIELKLFSLWGSSDPMLNVFYYLVSGSSGSATECRAEFRDYFLPIVKTALSTNVAFTDIWARNLFDPTDFSYQPLSPVVTCDLTGETLPEHDAVAFSSNRNDLRIRAGRKRFSGIPETQQQSGALVPAYQTILLDVASALGHLLDGSMCSYVPVIVMRIKEGTAPNITYRLPESQGELVYSIADAWTFNVRVTTQNTRKV